MSYFLITNITYENFFLEELTEVANIYGLMCLMTNKTPKLYLHLVRASEIL